MRKVKVCFPITGESYIVEYTVRPLCKIHKIWIDEKPDEGPGKWQEVPYSEEDAYESFEDYFACGIDGGDFLEWIKE